MPGIERTPSKTYTQRLGNDAIYGMGTDGNVTISTDTVLSSDKYYNNLTIDAGKVLYTNGFRVFVKDTLTLNGFLGMGSVTANVVGEPVSTISDGTVAGMHSNTSISYSIGGAGGGPSAGTATLIPTSVLNNVEELIFGVVRNPSSESFDVIRGGSAGSTGNTTAALTNNDSWTGKDGSPGQAGSPNQNVVGALGGKGNPGTATGATAGTGGVGGSGGGIVMVIAKNITGAGKIFSIGKSGVVGNTGNPGTAGNAAGHLAAVNSTCNAHGVNCHGNHNNNCHGNHSCYGNHNADTCNAHGCNAHQHVCNAAHWVCNGHAYNNHNCSDTCHVANIDCVSASVNCHGNHSCYGHHNGSFCNAHGCNAHQHVCNAHAHACTGTHNSAHGAFNGGAGGVAAPAVTGGRGGAGGGGGIIVVTDSTPINITYDLRAGLTAGSGAHTAQTGYNYVILNT